MANSWNGWLRRRQLLLALALLAGRVCLSLPAVGRQASTLAAVGCAAALGACLWWVARRQIHPEAGMLALALYLAAPVWHAGRAAGASLGLFVLLYTAVGVTHATQGPRHKWPPRLGLLTASALATALLDPPAAAVGLGLALACMLVLGRGRLRVLMAIWTGTAALAAAAVLLRPMSLDGVVRAEGSAWPAYIGIGAALALALGYWLFDRRARFFGNTAPLLGAAACIFAGAGRLTLATPLVLLGIAGILGDALESRGRRWWMVLCGLCVLAQAASALLQH